MYLHFTLIKSKILTRISQKLSLQTPLKMFEEFYFDSRKMQQVVRPKGQEISKDIFLATPLPKKQTKFFERFLS